MNPFPRPSEKSNAAQTSNAAVNNKKTLLLRGSVLLFLLTFVYVLWSANSSFHSELVQLHHERSQNHDESPVLNIMNPGIYGSHSEREHSQRQSTATGAVPVSNPYQDTEPSTYSHRHPDKPHSGSNTSRPTGTQPPTRYPPHARTSSHGSYSHTSPRGNKEHSIRKYHDIDAFEEVDPYDDVNSSLGENNRRQHMTRPRRSYGRRTHNHDYNEGLDQSLVLDLLRTIEDVHLGQERISAQIAAQTWATWLLTLGCCSWLILTIVLRKKN